MKTTWESHIINNDADLEAFSSEYFTPDFLIKDDLKYLVFWDADNDEEVWYRPPVDGEPDAPVVLLADRECINYPYTYIVPVEVSS